MDILKKTLQDYLAWVFSMNAIDIKGQKYGRLTVLEKSEPIRFKGSGKTKIRWLCRCECGNTVVVTTGALRSGRTKSCGCYATEKQRIIGSKRKTHGMAGTRLYDIWRSMKKRCDVKTTEAYKNYGGRGIKICNEWANNYKSFYDWAISAGYKKGKEIDRIDNNGNYEPNNCRFVDEETQANNKRNVRLYTINGITKSLSQWCKDYDLDYYMVRQRIYKLGWTIEDALNKPKHGT